MSLWLFRFWLSAFWPLNVLNFRILNFNILLIILLDLNFVEFLCRTFEITLYICVYVWYGCRIILLKYSLIIIIIMRGARLTALLPFYRMRRLFLRESLYSFISAALLSFSTFIIAVQRICSLHIFQCSDNTWVNFQKHRWMHAFRLHLNLPFRQTSICLSFLTSDFCIWIIPCQ